MITDVSKFKAKHNGKVVKLKRASMKSYRGGQFYIRVFVGYSGNCDAQIMRVIGKPYKTKESKKNHGPNSFKIMTLRDNIYWFSKSEDEYYTSDLGLTANYAQLYHFSNESWNLLKELTQKCDTVNLLKILYGFNAQQIEERLLDMAWQEEMDREMDIYYGCGDE